MMNISFEKIGINEVGEMVSLAKVNNGNIGLTKESIEHWYFKNPSASYSLWKATVDGRMEGYATTNNFSFKINGKLKKVAMPQNVLTSSKVRGKGLFYKLYSLTEKDNLEKQNIDCFLTFTNKFSTGIFLNKLSYLAAKCPDILLLLFNPLLFFAKKSYIKIESLDVANLTEDNYTFDNALDKTKEYYRWRYSKYAKKDLHILEVLDNRTPIGHAILLTKKMKGIKFLVLADISLSNPKYLDLIVQSARNYSSRKFFPFMMMYRLNSQKKKEPLAITISDRFNFLVKAKTQEDTNILSQIDFTLFCGDMDIF